MATYRDEERPNEAGLVSEERSSTSIELAETRAYKDNKDPNAWDIDAETQQNVSDKFRRQWGARSSPTRWFFIGAGLLLLVAASFLLGRSTPTTVQTTSLTTPPGTASPITPPVTLSPTTSSGTPKRKGLIVATIKSTNVTWLADVPADWEVYQYVADDPYALLSVPRNQGNEAMVYLTYLVDHYDDLPDYMVFVHGHEKAWHQPEPLPFILKALDLDVLDDLGWASLRCTLQNTCEGGEHPVRPYEKNWITNILQGIHGLVYKPEDPWYEPLPEELAVPCCAQFAVTKKQTQIKPREFWDRLRAPLVRDLVPDFLSWNEGEKEENFDWRVGGAFEVSWHWFFSMPGVTCYDTEFCRNTIFQNKIHCDGKTWDWFSIETYQNITCTLDE